MGTWCSDTPRGQLALKERDFHLQWTCQSQTRRESWGLFSGWTMDAGVSSPQSTSPTGNTSSPRAQWTSCLPPPGPDSDLGHLYHP